MERRISRQVSRPDISGQIHVEQHEIGALGADSLQRFLAATRLDNRVTLGGQRGAQDAADLRLVVNNQYRGCAHECPGRE